MTPAGTDQIQNLAPTDPSNAVPPIDSSSPLTNRLSRLDGAVTPVKVPDRNSLTGSEKQPQAVALNTSAASTASETFPKHFSYTVLASNPLCGPLGRAPSAYILHFSEHIQPSQLRLEYVAGKTPKLVVLKTDTLGRTFELLGEIPTQAGLFNSDRFFLKFPNAPTLFYDTRQRTTEAIASYRPLHALPSDDEETQTSETAYIFKFARGLTLQDFRPEYRAQPIPRLVLTEPNGATAGQVLAEIRLPSTASDRKIFFLTFADAPTFIYRPEEPLPTPFLTQNLSFYGDPRGQLQATPEPSHMITFGAGVKREDLVFSYDFAPVMTLNIQHLRDRGSYSAPLERVVVQTPFINRDLFFLKFENENAYFMRYAEQAPIPAFTYTASASSDGGQTQQTVSPLKTYHIRFPKGLKLRHLQFELRNTQSPAFVVLRAGSTPASSEVMGEIALDARRASILLEFPEAGVYRFDEQQQTVKPLFSYVLQATSSPEIERSATLFYRFSFFDPLTIEDLKFDYNVDNETVFTVSRVNRASDSLERLGTIPIITMHNIHHEIQLKFPDGQSFAFNKATKQAEPLHALVQPPRLTDSTHEITANLAAVSPPKSIPAQAEAPLPPVSANQTISPPIGPMLDALSRSPAVSSAPLMRSSHSSVSRNPAFAPTILLSASSAH